MGWPAGKISARHSSRKVPFYGINHSIHITCTPNEKYKNVRRKKKKTGENEQSLEVALSKLGI
jgi:hypothetical protein